MVFAIGWALLFIVFIVACVACFTSTAEIVALAYKGPRQLLLSKNRVILITGVFSLSVAIMLWYTAVTGVGDDYFKAKLEINPSSCFVEAIEDDAGRISIVELKMWEIYCNSVAKLDDTVARRSDMIRAVKEKHKTGITSSLESP